jgi:tetratricopeptide (TPR) repeat protein
MPSRKQPRAEECNQLGAYFYSVGQLDLAIAQFRQAVKKAPHAAAYWANLGAALIDAGQWNEAAAALARAVRLRPDDPGALFALGQLADLRGESEAAKHYYQQVVQVEPHGRFGRRAKEKLSGWRPPRPVDAPNR